MERIGPSENSHGPAPKRSLTYSIRGREAQRLKYRRIQKDSRFLPAAANCSDIHFRDYPRYFLRHDHSAFNPVAQTVFSSPPPVDSMPPPPLRKPLGEEVCSSESDEHAESRTSDLGERDAMHFVKLVKTEFHDCPRVYNEFLAIMKRFKLQEVDTATVTECISRLFRARPDLIRGFNIFLPEGSQISLDENGLPEGMSTDCTDPMATLAMMAAIQPAQLVQKDSIESSDESSAPIIQRPTPQSPSSPRSPEKQFQSQKAEFDHAMKYVETVKDRFFDKEQQSDIYTEFIALLKMYQAENLELELVLSHLCRLFVDHPDLIQGFVYFLPDHLHAKALEHLDGASASF